MIRARYSYGSLVTELLYVCTIPFDLTVEKCHVTCVDTVHFGAMCLAYAHLLEWALSLHSITTCAVTVADTGSYTDQDGPAEAARRDLWYPDAGEIRQPQSVVKQDICRLSP
jgi:hypothetical protein